ncbi:uncharacterized protein BDCG_01599 [Blastomyces dermatitidis ER-3]|uniref:Uncharacterized protein n=2 Tax=Ajellomyces dermatitidis TaxID=5039 RepID=F2T7B9_AJEDA|nr:uncharacterized protein BDCG_01599 [Blastomyces dermatitidis ER-3]EEQ86479.2 hypothetical protein BDCG_01599 [Blastomyces dermatitidis ER-3]EGE79132.1 hypothetical protein BDDG_02070 [Blastomyces dermatitidis ATCC 18188]
MARQQSLDSQRPIMAPSVWFFQFSLFRNTHSLRPFKISFFSATSTSRDLKPSQSKNSNTELSPNAPRRKQVSSQRNSQRFSTISATGSLALSDHTVSSTMTGDSRLAEIKELGAGLERLENKPLTKQRFVPTPEKTDNLNKLALGAKVERALGRRMSSQDAIMRKRTPIDEEKEALKMQAGS